MWNNLSRILFVVSLAALLAVAYLYWVYAKELQQNVAALKAVNHDLAFENIRLKEHVVYLTQRIDEDFAKVSQEKEEELGRVRHTYNEMLKALQTEIDAGQIRITRLADRLSVNIVDKILFPSGEAMITPEGRQVLERVGHVLTQVQDKIIRIEGHTDNVPTGKSLKGRFETNWELSAARATNVVRFLQEAAHIDPQLLEAVALGENHPIADNNSASGRSQNRRIEIILFPRVRSLAGQSPTMPKPNAINAKPSLRGSP
jgi:chemotaxis protein MotB